MLSSFHVHKKWWCHHFMCTRRGDVIISCAQEVVMSSFHVHMKRWCHHFMCTRRGDVIISCAQEESMSSFHVHKKGTWGEEMTSWLWHQRLCTRQTDKVITKKTWHHHFPCTCSSIVNEKKFILKTYLLNSHWVTRFDTLKRGSKQCRF